MLATLEQEIGQDCDALESVMAHLDVRPSRFKTILAGAAEVAGRLKSNGRIMRRSPSSTVVELEALAAGIITKRNLWRALRAVAPDYAGALDATELDGLIKRATAQFERVVDAPAERPRTRSARPERSWLGRTAGRSSNPDIHVGAFRAHRGIRRHRRAGDRRLPGGRSAGAAAEDARRPARRRRPRSRMASRPARPAVPVALTSMPVTATPSSWASTIGRLRCHDGRAAARRRCAATTPSQS